MIYDGAKLHVRVNGPGMEHVHSVDLDMDEETAKKLADSIDNLNKQCDPSEFVAWITCGYHN